MKKTRLSLFCLGLLAGCTSVQTQDIGEKYLGTKYLNDPLGEEKFPDTDPLVRFDAFDCTTFVETVLADGDLDKLTKIRYKNGQINFLNRNHFIELDWLQNNHDIVENVSNQYGKTASRKLVIDKQNWLKRVHNTNTKILPQSTTLEYIPYSNLTEINNKEPLIVLFVIDNPKKRDKIGTDLAVPHMGFLLPNGKLRHASSNNGMVVDVDFYDYTKRRAKNKNNIGVSLVKIK